MKRWMGLLTSEDGRFSVGGAISNVLAFEKVLSGTLFGAADHGFEAGALLTGDETEASAGGTGEDCPEGIICFSRFFLVFEQEQGAGLHLFRYPHFEKIQLRYHVGPF